MKMFSRILLLFVALAVLPACRGFTSDQAPVHPNLNMDFQERYEAQEANPLFADGRSMRTPVAGTVARGHLAMDDSTNGILTGKNASGGYLDVNPLPVTEEMITRGRERYDIYCAPCHGQAGDGQGMVWLYGQKAGMVVQPTSYHSDYLRDEVNDGYLYNVVANGVRTMAGYKAQIPVNDRWKIVAYVRALQRSQHAPAELVPDEVRAQLDQNAAAVPSAN